MFGSGCKQVRFRASKNVNSQRTALPETLAREALKSSSKDLLTEKTLAGRPKTSCLSVNSKQYKQPGEVELAATISSRNSPEKNMDK